jgi:hypothetical protein
VDLILAVLLPFGRSLPSRLDGSEDIQPGSGANINAGRYGSKTIVAATLTEYIRIDQPSGQSQHK